MIEMLVVLLLSSIVVGIIYATFLTVSRYQNTLTDKYKSNEDVTSIYFLIQKDFERCETINRTDEYTIECLDMLRTPVMYTFNDESIVRHQLTRSDTFRCKIGKPVFKKDGKELQAKGALDELQVEIKCLPFHVNWVVVKQYDAAGLVPTMKSDSIQ
jgi:hypothetical protein